MATTTLAPPAASQTAHGLGVALDRLLTRWGDTFNPILVKETRQALKSRQFVMTFVLVLAGAWLWTIIGVTQAGGDIYYANYGPTLFSGYFFILCAALWVVVPYSAFRSLASEREDRTFELVAITTLRPRQIISGKLGSAALQMLIYLSSITPCLAFTYMLRGIDFPTILYLVFYAVLISLGLSQIGLLAATLSTERHWQAILSVVFVVGLVIAGFGLFNLSLEIVREGAIPFSDATFWLANAAFLTAYVSYFALFYYAAAAQLTFTSDNRSTRLRLVLAAQQVLLSAWIFGSWLVWFDLRAQIGGARSIDALPLISFFIAVASHWYFFGAILCGESPNLSPRVKRGLPQSVLGRVFLTWLNPGPATGYVFALCGMIAALVSAWIAVVIRLLAYGVPTSGTWEFTCCALLILFYLTIFLGIEVLLVRFVRSYTQVAMALPVLLQGLCVLAACIIPSLWRMLGPRVGLSLSEFLPLDILNPFVSMAYQMKTFPNLPPENHLMLLATGIAAAFIFLLNLPGLRRELANVRMAAPPRVVEEEALLHPAPPPKPLSPWD